MPKNDKLALFISYLKNERQYSKNTILSYQTDLLEAKSFWRENGGFVDWDKIQTRDIEVYLQSMAERKLSRNSQMRKMSSLRSFYRFLAKRKLIKVDPTQTIVLRTEERKLPQFFYAPEMKQVISSLQGNTALTERNLALFELFYTTGMRVSEVSSLKINQVDFDLQMILVHGKGNKDRYVAFDDKTKSALQNYLENARPKLLDPRLIKTLSF